MAEPAGTRPWIPGSGFDPGPQTARGVATSGGSARVRGGDLGRQLAAALPEREQVVERAERTARFERGKREDKQNYQKGG